MRNFSISIWVCALFMSLSVWSMQAIANDQIPKLKYFIMELNGERQLLEVEGVLNVSTGDELKILEAKLQDESLSPQVVNFVGFTSPKSIRGEDRNILMNTRTFNPRWALDENKELFKIRATTNKIHHGFAYVRVIKPKLLYLDVLVNGKNKVMREGEALALKESDKIKINKFVTNMTHHSDVKFKVVTSKKESYLKAYPRHAEIYEIQFSLDKKVFATVPMIVDKM